MMKYQKPEMDIIEFGQIDTIQDSTLYVPEDGSNTGGDEGSGGWNDL